MKNLTKLSLVFILGTAISTIARAQVVTGTTTADIDPSTGIITVTCETDLDGDAQEFYGAQVECTLTDQNQNVVAQGGYDDTYYEGYAQVVLTYQSTPGMFYTAVGQHSAFMVLSRDDDEQEPTEYDDYNNFEAVADGFVPGYDYFANDGSWFGPGPDKPTRQSTIKIANTIDTVGNPIPSATVAINFGAGASLTQGDPLGPVYNIISGGNVLGPLLGAVQGGGAGCGIGTEGVGTITPAGSAGPFIIKRQLGAIACFSGSSGNTQIYCMNGNTQLKAGQDDTGRNYYSTPVNGQVFDVDAPQVAWYNPDQTIQRIRYNFTIWVTNSSGQMISPKLNYWTRNSCHYYPTDPQAVPTTDVPSDNTAGLGTTNVTWNLQ